MEKEEQAMYMGIDVSKGYADFFLMDSRKNIVDQGFQLDDNVDGHQGLLMYLRKRSSAGVKIICGVESTGGYEQNWLTVLKKQKGQLPVEVYKVNPKGVKHQIESTLKRTITDSISAEGIAQYLANNYAQKRQDWHNSTFADDQVVAAQHCFRLIQGLIKQQTSRYNQLEKMLYQCFPELLTFCKYGIPQWMIRLLIRYPGRTPIRRAQITSIDGIKGISKAKAERIKALANTSVGTWSSPVQGRMVQILAEDIQHHQARIDGLKTFLTQTYTSADFEILKSIKGIGDWTSTALLMLIGSIDRFEGTDQIASFFGVNPKFKQSGDGKWGVHMSKQGSAAMRSILYIAATNVVMHDPYFKKLYHNYTSKGIKKKSVHGIIMHKLLRIIYGMLKSHTMFNYRIDETNQKETKNQSEKQISCTSRRYQKLNTEAPISRSNYKKRRAVLECQISESDISTASSSTTLLQK